MATRNHDPFLSPMQRLGRAKAKLRSLVGQGKTFFKRKPYATVIEADVNTGDQIHKVRFTRRLPAAMTGNVVEAFENLRSALDQTGYVAASLGGATAPKRAYFPIADTARQLEADVIGRGRCKELPPDILTVFRSFQPYKGGNDAIWAVNRIANSSKHCALSAALHCDGFRTVQPGYVAGNARIMTPSWDYEKDEMVFGAVGPGGSLKYDFEFTFFVTFREIPELVGIPALPLLDSGIREVERVINDTKTECRRIGILN